MTLTNRLLGYPDDARLLILNADDFGMCNSTNEAIIRALQAGLVRSTSLMAPCPWARHAMRYLQGHPEVPCAVHLTLLSDAVNYFWGPLTAKERVPSLVDQNGTFYSSQRVPELLAQVRLEAVEVEFRAQIEAVLAAGLQPSHLDWHSLRIDRAPQIFEIMFRLARDYGLALRAIGRAALDTLRAQGLPAAENDFVDSFSINSPDKAARYSRMLRELPAGLSEWAVHPGFDNLELLALEPDGDHCRQRDYDYWTSPEPREIIAQEGIILLDYRPLQAFWR